VVVEERLFAKNEKMSVGRYNTLRIAHLRMVFCRMVFCRNTKEGILQINYSKET
jgi:hypothetical protein